MARSDECEPGVSAEGASRTRVLLLCAGDGVRWAEHLGIPKQLITFGGERLLERTVRLVRLYSHGDIACVTRDERIRPSVPIFAPAKTDVLMDTLLSTVRLWRDTTVILLGDVFYTEACMRAIFANESEIAIFGRPWPSARNNCDHGELFALRFSRGAASSIAALAQRVAADARHGTRGNLWDLYHALCSLPPNFSAFEDAILQSVDDLTNDFDTAGDYNAVRWLYECAARTDMISRGLVATWAMLTHRKHSRLRRSHCRRAFFATERSRGVALGEGSAP